jgi:hypothetical protein
MQLPDSPSDDPESYSISLCSSTYAHSFAEAFSMFLAQMGTGHVGVTVTCDEMSDSIDLDDIVSENTQGQVNLGIDLILRHLKTCSNHERLEVMHQVNQAMAKAMDDPPEK